MEKIVTGQGWNRSWVMYHDEKGNWSGKEDALSRDFNQFFQGNRSLSLRFSRQFYAMIVRRIHLYACNGVKTEEKECDERNHKSSNKVITKSIVNRSIAVVVERTVESIGQDTSRYYIIDQRCIRLICTKHCMNHNRTYIAAFEEWHSTIKLYIRTFTIIYLLLREILFLRLSTIRLYRNDESNNNRNKLQQQQQEKKKANCIAYIV